MRQAGAVNVREVFGDFARAFDEGVAFRVPDVQPRGCVFGQGGKHEHRAALIFRAQQRREFRTGMRKIDVVDFQPLFERGIKFEQAEHFGAAGAEVRARALVEKVGLEEVESVAVHCVLAVEAVARYAA